MIRGFFRLIFYAVVMYLIYAVIRFFQNAGKKSTSSSRGDRAQVQGVMVKDEICNTYVPREEALQEVREGKEYFFCSRECQKKFLKRGKTG